MYDMIYVRYNLTKWGPHPFRRLLEKGPLKIFSFVVAQLRQGTLTCALACRIALPTVEPLADPGQDGWERWSGNQSWEPTFGFKIDTHHEYTIF